MLVRYAETLALHHELPSAQVQFCLPDGTCMDMGNNAHVVAHSHHSIHVLLSDGECIIKVSGKTSIEQEVHIHGIVDPRDHAHLRSAVPHIAGTVTGAGEGLHFIGLAGNLVPLPETLTTAETGRLFAQVCTSANV